MRALQGSLPITHSNAPTMCRAGGVLQQHTSTLLPTLLHQQQQQQCGAAAAAAAFCRHHSLAAAGDVASAAPWSAQQFTAAHRQLMRPTPQQQQQQLLQQRRCAASAAGAATPAATAEQVQSGAAAAAAADAAIDQLRSKLQLHNSMTRKKEVFTPRPGMGNKVQMYVCGVTVYDYSHIGHARVYVAFDVLYRLLRQLQYEVQYVRNFTDVDDKIIRRAAESGEDPLALAGRFIAEFHTDMAALGCLSPTAEPRATDYIPAMIDTINKIISNGHAYVLPDGDVYFDVASLPGYGRLSGRSQEDNRAGERVAVDERKRGPADFALWKGAKPGEPSWPSPWGPGRPGWHIECSSMIEALMGDVIDIHGGGRDLIFPHHENELAQSQAACGCGQQHSHSSNGDDSSSSSSSDGASAAGFVRYWLHNGFVNVDSEKMSKSLGNFFTIRDVLQSYHPTALRWFLVSSQYRTPLNYTQRGLDEASDRVYYVYQTLADVYALLAEAGEAGAAAVKAAAAGVTLSSAAAAAAGAAGGAAAAGAAGGKAAAVAAASTVGVDLLCAVLVGLLDDLSTPTCVGALSPPLKAINDLLTTKAGRKNPQRLELLASYQRGLLLSLDLLGLSAPVDLHTSLGELRALALTRAQLSEEQVTERIAARAAARQDKDFAAADAVRKELAAKGVMLMDAPQGTTWRPGLPEGDE